MKNINKRLKIVANSLKKLVANKQQMNKDDLTTIINNFLVMQNNFKTLLKNLKKVENVPSDMYNVVNNIYDNVIALEASLGLAYKKINK